METKVSCYIYSLFMTCYDDNQKKFQNILNEIYSFDDNINLKEQTLDIICKIYI